MSPVVQRFLLEERDYRGLELAFKKKEVRFPPLKREQTRELKRFTAITKASKASKASQSCHRPTLRFVVGEIRLYI